MKRSLFFFILFISTLFYSCSKPYKDINDYFPMVETTSATVLEDGSVQLKGIILSSVADPVDIAGFCMDTNPNPTMLMGQSHGSFNDDKNFVAEIKGFKRYKTYYFRAWAVNGYGYTYGKTISLYDIAPTVFTAPCTLDSNSYNIGSGTEKYSTIWPLEKSSMDYWTIDAVGSNHNFNFNFKNKPKNGVYDVSQKYPSQLLEKEVRIEFYASFYSRIEIKQGAKAYVYQLSANKWELVVCDGEYDSTFGTRDFTTRIFFTE